MVKTPTIEVKIVDKRKRGEQPNYWLWTMKVVLAVLQSIVKQRGRWHASNKKNYVFWRNHSFSSLFDVQLRIDFFEHI